jgi:hypothetical protein
MRKESILSKLLLWKSLTSELSAHFDTEVSKLPTLVQRVLEVRSEQHELDLAPKKTKPVTVPPKSVLKMPKMPKSGRWPRREMLVKDKMAEIMSDGKPYDTGTIRRKLLAAGYFSSNVATIAGRESQMFERLARGRYKLIKPAVSPHLKLVPPVKVENKYAPAVIHVAVALAKQTGPFRATTIRKLVHPLNLETVRTILDVFAQDGFVQKSGANWEVKDRPALVKKLAECHTTLKSKAAA